MKLFFMRAWGFVMFRLRLYYLWSRIYQWLRERKYNHTVLPSLPNLDALTNVLGGMHWRKDTYIQLWDAMSTAKAVYARHMNSKDAGDCEDISNFAADRIENMKSRDLLPQVDEVGLLSVIWIDSMGNAGGHTVCILSYKQITNMDNGIIEKTRWAHVSNWYDGEFQKDLMSVKEIVRSVMLTGGGGRAACTAWSFVRQNLKAVVYGSGRGM